MQGLTFRALLSRALEYARVLEYEALHARKASTGLVLRRVQRETGGRSGGEVGQRRGGTKGAPPRRSHQSERRRLDAMSCCGGGGGRGGGGSGGGSGYGDTVRHRGMGTGPMAQSLIFVLFISSHLVSTRPAPICRSKTLFSILELDMVFWFHSVLSTQ